MNIPDAESIPPKRAADLAAWAEYDPDGSKAYAEANRAELVNREVPPLVFDEMRWEIWTAWKESDPDGYAAHSEAERQQDIAELAASADDVQETSSLDAEPDDLFDDLDEAEDEGPLDTLHAGVTPLVRSGEFGCVYARDTVGKSFLCAVWAYQEMISGHHVVWIDYEYQRDKLLKRLRLLGLSDDERRRYFHYLNGQESSRDKLAEITERIRRWRESSVRVTVVIDAFTGFHDAHGGGDQNQTHTVERTYNIARRLFSSVGATVCFLDHENASGEINGNPRKRGGLDWMFRLVTVGAGFAVGVPGRAELLQAKPRDGQGRKGDKLAELVCDGHSLSIEAAGCLIEAAKPSPETRARGLALGQMRRKLGRQPEATDRELRNSVDSKYRNQVTPELIAEARV